VIRPATEEDVPRIVEMGEAFHGASPWKVLPFSPVKFEQAARSLIANPSSTILVNDALTGMIGMMSGPVYFCDDATVAQEAFWWCEEPRDALRLLTAAENWCVSIGAGWSCMVRLEGVTPRLEAYYERRGYTPTEHYYLKRL
jgi:hypothetical protein